MARFSDLERLFVIQRKMWGYSWDQLLEEFNQTFTPQRTMNDLRSIFYPSLQCSTGGWHPLEAVLETCGPMELHGDQDSTQPSNAHESSAVVSENTESTTPLADRPVVCSPVSHAGDDNLVATTDHPGIMIHRSAPEQRRQLRLQIPTFQTTVAVPAPVTADHHVLPHGSGRSSYGSTYEALRAAAIIAATGPRRSLSGPDDPETGHMTESEAVSEQGNDEQEDQDSGSS